MALDFLYRIAVEQTETAVKPPPFFGALAVFFLQMLVELRPFIVDFLTPLTPVHVDNILGGLIGSIS